MVERGMGRGRIPERSLCSGADCAGGSALVHCAFHVAADFHHGVFSVCAMVGYGCTSLRDAAIGARHQWHSDEYQFNVAGAAAFDVTGAEHFLLLWHLS